METAGAFGVVLAQIGHMNGKATPTRTDDGLEQLLAAEARLDAALATAVGETEEILAEAERTVAARNANLEAASEQAIAQMARRIEATRDLALARIRQDADRAVATFANVPPQLEREVVAGIVAGVLGDDAEGGT